MMQLSLNLFSNETLLEGLNPDQQEAVMAPLDTALQVMAGAGTGKTEVITRRFAKLALDLKSHMPEETDVTELLWVSTFTEKAAKEMKGRIAEYLMQTTGIPLNPRAWIGTFHGLCHRILQQHSEINSLTGFSLLTDVELELLRERLITVLLEGNPEALTESFSVEELPFSPACLSLRSLLEIDLTDFSQLFEEILFQVIPRIKAAGLSPRAFYTSAVQQAEAYTHLITAMPVSDSASGFIWQDHEDYARHWRRHLDPISHPRFSFTPSEWVVELEAQKALSKQKNPPSAHKILIEQLKPLYKTGCFVSYNGRKKKDAFSSADTDFSGLQQGFIIEKKLIEIVTATYLLYQNTLKNENACDYDDLIMESLQLLRDHSDIRQQYQEHFAHFMVDEFQDSNGAQLQLIQLLSGREKPGITAVGDMKQSIYGFRFAEPENLRVLFEGLPAYRSQNLAVNYRSQKPILAVANRITEMMLLDKPEALLPAHHEEEGSPDVLWLHADDGLTTGEAKGLEVRWIAETIAQLLQEETCKPSEIAVLTRDHGKALQVEAALEALGIPAIRQRNLGFFQVPIIQQAVSLLELAENPHDDFAMINLLQRKFSHRELYLLAKHRQFLREFRLRNELSYYETLLDLLRQPDIAHEELHPLLPALRFLVTFIGNTQAKKCRTSPEHLFSWMLQAFPLIPTELFSQPSGQKAHKQLETLKKMLYHWNWRAVKPLSLSDMLVLIKRHQSRDELELPMEEEQFFEEAVRIMTVHGAKGLQFPVVFMAGIDNYRKSRYEGLLTVDPQYPGKLGFGLFLNRFEDERTLKKLIYNTVWKVPRSQEEELRLFYVGVTRARQRLYLSSWSRSFPYMNPVFFGDLPVQTLSPDEVSWKSPEERTRIQSRMIARFWQTPHL